MERTGIVLKYDPFIRRNCKLVHKSAIVSIPDDDQFALALREMRYFELAPGKPSRGLPLDSDNLFKNYSRRGL